MLGWHTFSSVMAHPDPSFPLLCGVVLPRGAGFGFNLFKLATDVVLFLAWVRACWWVDADARRLNLPLNMWNSLLFVAGLIGLLVLATLPWLAGWPLALLIMGGTFGAYIHTRNASVPVAERVFTSINIPAFFRGLTARELAGTKKKPVEEPEETGPSIRFLGRGTGQGDPVRVRRAEESRGFQTALNLLEQALMRRATDIHLEPHGEEMTVRFRVDGIMQQGGSLERPNGESIVNIFKVLANLDITEKRKPQDGGFAAEVGRRPSTRQVDFRIATAGSVAGEKLVMRILDRARQVTSLAQVGLRGKVLTRLQDLVRQPHGLIIVCGPTGSGKTTTVCACLHEIDRYTKNIITIENPVEYHIPNVTQIEVNLKADKTFASELRSILRQDPDIISVGEIRDRETAEIACQAAQTGHLVFTTLHANDAVSALVRLGDLGVPPYLIGAAVTAVLSQRLVRVLCPRCKQRYKPNADLLRKANLPADRIKYFYRPPEVGERTPCKFCGGTGYYGRTGLFEVFVLNDRVRGLLREHPDFEAVRQEALKSGMKLLQEDGLRLVIEGTTSIQEILRVCK
jgi:general secretion pathway protein E